MSNNISPYKAANQIEFGFSKEVERNSMFAGMFLNLDRINVANKELSFSIYRLDEKDKEYKYGEVDAIYDNNSQNYRFSYKQELNISNSNKDQHLENIFGNNLFFNNLLQQTEKESITETQNKIAVFKLLDGVNYGIRAKIDGEQMPTHRLSKEDREAFFNKSVTKEQLAEKYFNPNIEKEVIGTITFFNGSDSYTSTYTDKDHYLDTINKAIYEGEKIQTNTILKDPNLLKAIDDIYWDEGGLDNPHDIDYYNKKYQNQNEIVASIFKMRDGSSYAIRAKINGEQFSAKKLDKKDVSSFFDKSVTKEQLAEKYFGGKEIENKRENNLKR